MPLPGKSDEITKDRFELNHHDELIIDPVLAQAEKAVIDLRSLKGEIKEVLTPQVQEEDIYPNPEIFVLFEYIRKENLEPHELDLLLKNLTIHIDMHSGSNMLMLGSGWGVTGRELVRVTNGDVHVTHVDNNPAIVAMDRVTNQVQGFGEHINSYVADATKQEELKRLMGDEPLDVATVGLMRYLDPEQRIQMLHMLMDTAPKGTKFMMREVNWQTMGALKNELDERGIRYVYEKSDEATHLRYTRIFSYYYMYKNLEPMVSAIKDMYQESNPDFNWAEFQSDFKKRVDELSADYPEINLAEIFGENTKQEDLRFLLVLADLAGEDKKTEEILIFQN